MSAPSEFARRRTAARPAVRELVDRMLRGLPEGLVDAALLGGERAGRPESDGLAALEAQLRSALGGVVTGADATVRAATDGAPNRLTLLVTVRPPADAELEAPLHAGLDPAMTERLVEVAFATAWAAAPLAPERVRVRMLTAGSRDDRGVDSSRGVDLLEVGLRLGIDGVSPRRDVLLRERATLEARYGAWGARREQEPIA